MAILLAGSIIIIIGMMVFDMRAHFTSLSSEGRIDFLTCRTENITSDPSIGVSQDPDYCIEDFFTLPHLFGVTVLSLGLQFGGAAIILLVLARKKLGIATTTPSTRRKFTG